MSSAFQTVAKPPWRMASRSRKRSPPPSPPQPTTLAKPATQLGRISLVDSSRVGSHRLELPLPLSFLLELGAQSGRAPLVSVPPGRAPSPGERSRESLRLESRARQELDEECRGGLARERSGTCRPSRDQHDSEYSFHDDGAPPQLLCATAPMAAASISTPTPPGLHALQARGKLRVPDYGLA